jgi:large subunit ribosomal protein L24
MKRKFLKKGDLVVVITGNDKGKTGKILRNSGERILVEGVNIRKKHMKPTQQNQKGQIIDIEVPIHASNVMPCIDEKGVRLKVNESKGKKTLAALIEGKSKTYREV